MRLKSQYRVVAICLFLGIATSQPTHGLPFLPTEHQDLGEAMVPAALAQVNIGYEALNKGDLDAAQKAFLQAAKLDSRSVVPLLGLAEVSRLRNQRDEVEKWLKQALAVAPKSADAQRAWGRYLFATGNPSSAEMPCARRRNSILARQSVTSIWASCTWGG